MGNKSSVKALRLGISQPFDADWYAESRLFAQTLYKDMKMREYLEAKFKNAVIVRILISRTSDNVELSITCLKPSMIIGRKGGEIEGISKALRNIANQNVRIRVFDIKKPELQAACIAHDIANELSRKGASCRRIVKKYVQNAKRCGALGVRIECAGRISGAEIARSEWYQEGSVPRQKFRADIDYAQQTSFASWGTTGVKVWINKGEVVKKIIEKDMGEQ
jgi:small subunit ribosomal protein S3